MARWTMGPCLVDDIHLYMCISVCNADSFGPPSVGYDPGTRCRIAVIHDGCSRCYALGFGLLFWVWFFGFLVLCILKVYRVAGGLHRAVGPMHASMSGCRLRTLPLRGVRIHDPVDHGVLPGGWYSSP